MEDCFWKLSLSSPIPGPIVSKNESAFITEDNRIILKKLYYELHQLQIDSAAEFIFCITFEWFMVIYKGISMIFGDYLRIDFLVDKPVLIVIIFANLRKKEMIGFRFQKW
jgi:hypothetical protein